MNSGSRSGSRGGIKAGILLAGCVGVLALPSAVLAFGTSFRIARPSASMLESFDPDSPPENLSQVIAMRSLAKGHAFPFTPAGTPDRPERAVTVAVRVDPEAAKAIIVRSRPPIAGAENEPGALRMVPAGFNLGVSRGYQNFAQNLVQAPAGHNPGEMPDLRKFTLAPGTASLNESRFSPRISIDENRAPGRAPRTFSGDAGEVDLGGAYRVTKNLDVTAGVRYSQDRERLLPLTDGRQDSQAVYVGTQFRF